MLNIIDVMEDIFCGEGINTALGCIPVSDTGALVGWFFQRFLGLVGGVALILSALGAFQIITSGGNPEKVKRGRELIESAISGLLFVIFSLFLLRFIGVDVLHLPGLTK